MFESLSILNVIFYLQSLLLNTHSIVFRNFLAHWNSKYIFFFISAVYVYYFVLIKHADHCNTDIYLIVLMPILIALDTKHGTEYFTVNVVWGLKNSKQLFCEKVRETNIRLVKFLDFNTRRKKPFLTGTCNDKITD